MSTMAETTSIDLRINGVLGRLETVLDQENERIGIDPQFNYQQTNDLKSRCLYEMTMLLRDNAGDAAGAPFADRLAMVRQKLEANSIKLKAHMEAVRNVADLLKEAASAAEDDGTYSADQFRVPA